MKPLTTTMHCALSLALALAAGTTSAATWSDTEAQLLYGTEFNDNANSGGPKFAKTILTLEHASGYDWGSNFFFVDMAKSDSDDGGYGDVYGEFYTTLSYSKLAKKDWSKEFVRDVGLTLGLNYGSKNSPFGSNARVLLAGPTFSLGVPGATFFNVDVLAYRDVGRFSGFGGGYLCGEKKTTYQVTPAWNIPFSIGTAKFTFQGFMDVIGSHGTCERQILTQPQLRWDVGNHFGQPGRFLLGFEYQYWHNKFGLDGVKESFPQILGVFKF